MKVLLQVFRQPNRRDATWIAVSDVTKATRQFVSIDQGWDPRGVYFQFYDSAEQCDRYCMHFASSMLHMPAMELVDLAVLEVGSLSRTNVDGWKQDVTARIRSHVYNSGPKMTVL